MRKILSFLLAVAFLGTSFLQAGDEDSMDAINAQTDKLWRSGSGAHDGSYTSVALSMLGWGVGLGAGIGILAAVLHQSRTDTSHTSHAHCD